MAQKNGSYDVVIVGGGPAGSTAASVLAQKGRKVLVLEKEKFPRYHIGESLLPYAWFPMQRTGMIEKMNASPFVRKYGVQFVTRDGNVSTPFYFHTHMKHEAAITWQVLRSEFDRMLLDNAREKGAEVLEESEAVGLLREGQRACGVAARTGQGERREFPAPMTIDASGRGVFAIKQNDWRKWDPALNKVAVWTYFRGAKRDPGIDGGSTTVAFLPERGWFWYIPLHDDLTSVGVVGERDYLFDGGNDLAEIYRREVEKNAWIKDHVAAGRRCDEYRITKEFSYRARHSAEDGLVLIGDAFAFLDPVFSSGVYLAMRGGELAADAVDRALAEGDVSAARFDAYADFMRREIESMRKLVYAFYDKTFSFGKFIRARPEFHGDMTDCLIGNLNHEFQELFSAVAEFTTVPAPLPYGRARMTGTEAMEQAV
jgi:flavin-dependent dehydrogenase